MGGLTDIGGLNPLDGVRVAFSGRDFENDLAAHVTRAAFFPRLGDVRQRQSLVHDDAKLTCIRQLDDRREHLTVCRAGHRATNAGG